MKISALSIALAVAAILSAVWITMKPEKSPERKIATSPVKKSRQPHQRLMVERDEVVQMGPEDWKKRFAKSPSPGNPSTRADILRISAEMQEMIAAGSALNGEDVLVHADAIRALLEDPGED